jgi:hypothetical protein
MKVYHYFNYISSPAQHRVARLAAFTAVDAVEAAFAALLAEEAAAHGSKTSKDR